MDHLTTNKILVGKRALLVGAGFGGQPAWEVDEHLDELDELARSAGAAAVGRAVQHRKAIEVRTFIGRGKAEEVGRAADHLEADVIVFDDDLSPRQVKNLEEIVGLAVLDRSSLILELFHQRARSREARTQVELARLRYLLPRLTRRWTHLSRQVGGIGVRGGEGETQLEVDRRLLRDRIRRLEKELGKIERTRQVQRRSRRNVPQVALAGYTNAGKSTLFNRLTHGSGHVENRLFATLDSKLRRGALDPQNVVIFADTVGFIRKLPHHLVASFRSTLEEITCADQVLHVIDRSSPRWSEQVAVAEEVLQSLDVESANILTVFNKVDLLAGEPPEDGDAISISATTGEGLEALKSEILDRLKLSGRTIVSSAAEIG